MNLSCIINLKLVPCFLPLVTRICKLISDLDRLKLANYVYSSRYEMYDKVPNTAGTEINQPKGISKRGRHLFIIIVILNWNVAYNAAYVA